MRRPVRRKNQKQKNEGRGRLAAALVCCFSAALCAKALCAAAPIYPNGQAFRARAGGHPAALWQPAACFPSAAARRFEKKACAPFPVWPARSRHLAFTGCCCLRPVCCAVRPAAAPIPPLRALAIRGLPPRCPVRAGASPGVSARRVVTPPAGQTAGCIPPSRSNAPAYTRHPAPDPARAVPPAYIQKC